MATEATNKDAIRQFRVDIPQRGIHPTSLIRVTKKPPMRGLSI